MAKKKIKIPKKMAGVRVPKTLRKSHMVDVMLNNPLGRQVLADALVAAAAGASAALIKNREEVAEGVREGGEAVAKTTVRAGTVARDVVSDAAGAFSEVVGDAARDILPEFDKRRRGKGKSKSQQAARH